MCVIQVFGIKRLQTESSLESAVSFMVVRPYYLREADIVRNSWQVNNSILVVVDSNISTANDSKPKA